MNKKYVYHVQEQFNRRETDSDVSGSRRSRLDGDSLIFPTTVPP